MSPSIFITRSSIANLIEHVHHHRSIIIEQNVDIGIIGFVGLSTRYLFRHCLVAIMHHITVYFIVVCLVEFVRKAKIMCLENLAHYSINSHLIIVKKNGRISVKYWGGGLELFSPPIPLTSPPPLPVLVPHPASCHNAFGIFIHLVHTRLLKPVTNRFVVKRLESGLIASTFTHSLANWLRLNNCYIVGGVSYLFPQALWVRYLYICWKTSSQGEVDY